MRLEDDFVMETKTHGTFAEHCENRFQSIISQNYCITNLMDILNRNGAEISFKDSEKEVIYWVKSERKETIIPFTCNWFVGSTTRYFLRGRDDLEIQLNDYSSTPPENLRDGEEYTTVKGVHCAISMVGDSSDVARDFQQYKVLIEEFYKSPEHVSALNDL